MRQPARALQTEGRVAAASWVSEESAKEGTCRVRVDPLLKAGPGVERQMPDFCQVQISEAGHKSLVLSPSQ